MKTVYVCGPISAPTIAERTANIERGRKAGLEVWRLGAVSLVPHLNSLGMQDAGIPTADIYLGDLALLENCDAMLRLEGWHNSRGCTYESAWAAYHGIPIFDSLANLKFWLASR